MKKQNSKNQKLGFSLIELSVVILVIGLLVVGITKGTAIMNKSKITSARSLTSSAPVPLTPDLVAWYETSLTTSFAGVNAIDGTTLTNTGCGSWCDNSLAKSNNAGAVTGLVTYVENAMNSLPVVRFPGTASNGLVFNASALNQKEYTIFVVEQRRSATGKFLSLIPATPGSSIGYSATGTITDANGNDSVITVPSYSQVAIPRILTFLNSATGTNKKVILNGGTIGTAVVGASTAGGTSTAVIGSDGTTNYNGDIAEIIIYSRGLTVDERNDIQAYLGKKYSITVSASAS